MRLLISAAALAGLLVGLASGASAKTLVYCADSAPEGFDPALYVTAATFDASAQLFYDRLVEFAPGSTALVPGLAEKWDVSPDGRTYTFHLRQGVHFQSAGTYVPKRDFSADDVVFTFARQSDRKNPWFAYSGGNWPYYTSLGLDKLIRSVDKLDASTVRVSLTRVDAGFLSDLAMDFASIVSKEYADALLKQKQPALFNTTPVGTGPFTFTRYDAGDHLYAGANPGYWRGAPKLSNVIFSITPAAADRLAKLKSGACQLAPIRDAAALAAAKAEPGLNVLTAPTADVVFLAFNASRPPFTDVRVRRAFSQAINRQAIADTIYGGLAEPATRLVPAGVDGADATVPADAFNAEAAKQALTDAGAGGLALELLVTKDARPYSPDLVGTANLISADLARAGVKASVEVAGTLSEYLRKSADKNRDAAALIGWSSANGNLSTFLSLLLSCDAVGKSNRSEWCDPAFTDLLAKARASSDPVAASAFLSEAQHKVADQAPLVPLVHTLQAVVAAKAVSDYAVDPLGRHNFAAVDIAE